jgi:hypothetical protein
MPFLKPLPEAGLTAFPTKRKTLCFCGFAGFWPVWFVAFLFYGLNDLLMFPVERKHDVRADIVFIIGAGRRI